MPRSRRGDRIPHLLSKRDRGTRVVFRERKLKWVGTCLMGVGIVLFAPQLGGIAAPAAMLGAAFLGLGLLMLRRFVELTLDLQRGEWTIRKGRGSEPELQRGALDEDSYVVFGIDIVRHESEEGAVRYLSRYTGEIRLSGRRFPIVVAQGRSEVGIRRKMEALARKLGLSLVDRSGNAASRAIEVHDLDTPLADQDLDEGLPEGVEIPPPDPGFTIRRVAGVETITLPSPHSLIHRIAGSAVPVLFLGMGSLVLALPPWTPGGHWILPGAVVLFWCVPTVWNREWIRLEAAELDGGMNLLGLRLPLWSMSDQEIEDVDQAAFTSLGRAHTAVRIRSDRRVKYLGRHLSHEGAQWLTDRVRGHLLG